MSSPAAGDDPRPLIAHVIYRLQVGGLENGVVNLVNRLPGGRYRRLHAPLVHRFIALSRELEQYLLAKIGLPARKLSRIYNGVDTHRFHPGESDALPAGLIDGRSVVFGTVGRMHGVKDQTNLGAAFVALCEERPALAACVRLVIIGDGPLRQPCLDLLTRAGLADLAQLKHLEPALLGGKHQRRHADLVARVDIDAAVGQLGHHRHVTLERGTQQGALIARPVGRDGGANQYDGHQGGVQRNP